MNGRLFKQKKINFYILGIILLMLTSTIITKTIIEAEQRSDSISGELYELEILSDQLDDYCDLIESQEIKEALFVLGQIRSTSRHIILSDNRQVNGGLIRSQLVIGNVVSEIRVLADIRESDDYMLDKLDMISVEYRRINDVLESDSNLIGSNEERFATLADRLEHKLELMFPIE